ncbi:hypothetical protein GFB56_22605 [Ensifer sp. T173]|uniref:Uncharacterized protein n=1 Tax=Ensifer canadensis TaxID=555315 RepID=A0AAW4FQH4_9HYPH|nr:hypothetical protein [Ensifer canadensis]
MPQPSASIYDAEGHRSIHQADISTLRGAVQIVDRYRRYWSGQPISSCPAESAANSLVNARMNKRHFMGRI